MRHLNIDWHSLIGLLETWRTLEYESKIAYLQLKPNQSTQRKQFDEEDCQALIDKRLLAVSTDGTKVRVPPEAREFSGAMRAMYRHRFYEGSTEAALQNYVRDHLTTEERRYLLHSTSYYASYSGSENIHVVARKDWLQQVLDLSDTKSASKWEQGHLPEPRYRPRGVQFEDGSPYFHDADVFDALKRLLATALTWARPVPLAGLAEHVTDVEPHVLHRAVMPAVRYLLLFPRLEGDGLEPVIGVWPEIAYLLHRPAPRVPDPVEPVETFHAPVLIEDMTSVLVAAAAEPLRVLASGGGLYAKDMKRLAESALVLPDWLMPGPEDDLGPAFDQDRAPVENRMLDAVQNCIRQDLLRTHQGERGRNQLQITPAGRDWLGKDVRERLRGMLDPWRASPKPKKQRKAPRWTVHAMVESLAIAEDDKNLSPWTPPTLRWGLGPEVRKIDWRAAFVDLLRDADGAFVSLRELLAYHSRVNNPLLGRREQGSYGPKPRLTGFYRYGFGGPEPTEPQLEELWDDLADDMIARHLVPLGAAEVGWLGDEPAIRLHDIGRYMLGLAEDFDYHARPEGTVIVQPNFEVAFLGPAPRAEALIGRLAERTGSHTGTMFRITRASVLAAAAAGMTADDALRDLAEVSSKPVPDNVQREVRGWFDATRHVKMKQAWLIEAPDEATATRILAAGGKQARQLTPTLVEITAAKKHHSALVRKLKTAGIFVR